LINAVFGIDATVSTLSFSYLYSNILPSLFLTRLLESMMSIRSSASRKMIVSSSTTPKDSRPGRM